MRGSKPGERRGGRQRGTPNKATVAKIAALKAASADPAIMPLQFLLGVMRDPTAPTDLRIQVARAAAPLVHGKSGTVSPANPMDRVGAVGCEGFTIDIEEAKALRNIRHRLGALQGRQYGKNGRPLTAAEIAEETELRALISKRSSALLCPPGYGPREAMEDSNRLHQLNCKRLSPPSCGGGELKGAEDVGGRFDHVLVDEYQDTNRLQSSILLGLKPTGQGLTVVGDDAQSIYSFRAATVRNILDFPSQFNPSANIITLDRNYRSTQTILSAANGVIGLASERFTKNLWTDRASGTKLQLGGAATGAIRRHKLTEAEIITVLTPMVFAIADVGAGDARVKASIGRVVKADGKLNSLALALAMDWIGWIRSSLAAALQWFEAHPGTAGWLEAVGSIAAIVFVYLFALFQGRRTKSHEDTDRIRRAQGLALVLVPVLTGFKPKIEAAIIQESKLEPPDEVLHLLDQLYVLGVAGGFVLQMVATLQANQRAERSLNQNEIARSSYKLIARQRLDDALRYCDDAIHALVKLTRVRTV